MINKNAKLNKSSFDFIKKNAVFFIILQTILCAMLTIVNCLQINPTTYVCCYEPKKAGEYIFPIKFAGKPISKSPFIVEVGPSRPTKIRAYGRGLEAGVVGFPATFTVETNGETGHLGTCEIKRRFVFVNIDCMAVIVFDCYSSREEKFNQQMPTVVSVEASSFSASSSSSSFNC